MLQSPHIGNDALVIGFLHKDASRTLESDNYCFPIISKALFFFIVIFPGFV